MISSVFDIANPQEYACVVRKYSAGHSALHIQAVSNFKPPDIFYMVFYPVEFFSGPMTWQGVDFQIGSAEETLEIFNRIERYRHVSKQALMNRPYNLRLYIIKTPLGLIQIVAAEAKLHREEWILS